MSILASIQVGASRDSERLEAQCNLSEAKLKTLKEQLDTAEDREMELNAEVDNLREEVDKANRRFEVNF